MNWCTLEQTLREIIHQGTIQTFFQPIVDLHKQKVLGHEALTRGPSDSPLFSAGVLFETAERAGLQESLEHLCRRQSAQRFKALGVDGLLFINVSPQALEAPTFSLEKLDKLLAFVEIDPRQVVLELSERYPASDISETLKALGVLKSRGFRIAIDDLGTGYSGLKLWSEVKPDYVKIDRHFVRDIDSDLVKREFVASVVQLANGMGCNLIAEGVETEAEVKTVQDLGISLCQGFYFGKPKPVPVISNLFKFAKTKSDPISLGKVGSLAACVQPISSNTSLKEVSERFSSAGFVSSIPVVEERRPVGMISKWSLLELFSLPFGRALHENKPVKQYMAHNPIVVAWDEDLSEVSRLLTDEEDLYIRQHFIIERDGLYHGLGSTRDVLKRITDMKIRSARYANPLTLLPGNVPINEKLQELETSGRDYTLAYFDIDHFKPLNDVLGYARGDQVIQLLANILRTHVPLDHSFIGHVGGDDFVVIFEDSVSVIEVCETVQRCYAEDVLAYYPETNVRQGYISAHDRSGRQQRFPLSALSVGVVYQDCLGVAASQDIAALAAQAKKAAKQSQNKLATLSMSGFLKDLPDKATAETQANELAV
ncbi:bifunctional diguanylate cyclase/phosphodiesterase [Litoribacillus peritrichatus]